jgi:hypothetical protein
MGPGINDKNNIDWSLVLMGITMVLSLAFLLSQLM